MRIVVLAPLITAVCIGCTKEEEDPTRRVRIDFLTDSGLVYMNDTVGLADTLRVAVQCTAGNDALERLYVSVAKDDSAAQAVDTIGVNADPFTWEGELVMRPFAGTERWTFTVEEGDGDRTARSLTFVVQ
jgi:hypothetical protein